MKIKLDPEFTTSLWQLGFISDEEYKNYMMAEKEYNVRADVEPKHKPMYALVETKFSDEVLDFIKNHADVETNSHVTTYKVNNQVYIEFNGE